MDISIYILASFHGNPEGYGKAIAFLEYIKSNGQIHTRMETVELEGTKNALLLKTCVKAIERLNKPCHITIYVDCPYIQGTLNRRLLEQWKQRDWKRATGQSPANLSDWKRMYNLLGVHQVTVEKYNKKYDKELKRILEGKRIWNEVGNK
ncbi:RNase H family protein [Velocimicrobium porci]|uniref:RNase H family protein n=1 Tax=Velocimicrobium porci TaxID=2606634 RepID=UPI00197BFD65|nr:RNase H family protein [Velocimicrobium porci]